MTVDVRPAGDQAVLLEVVDNAAALHLASRARARLGEAAQDVVVGHRTMLVVWAPGRPRPDVDWSQLAAGVDEDEPRVAEPEVVLDVRYDGPDLHAVAALCELSPEALVMQHTSLEYRVAFVGFSPGFAYLLAGEGRIEVPRRDHPRPSVPAGSVAIGGPYTAAYPAASPGGWQLIGRTDARLFDADRAQPALLTPGATVRLRALHA